MAFKYSHHLLPCRLPKLDASGASVEGHGYKWPSSLLSICRHDDYPRWILAERQLGATPTKGLLVLLPSVAVLITHARCWRGVT